MVSYMMSSDDFKELLGDDIKIVEFPHLEQYNDINELLPNKKDYCIIFYIENIINASQIGHWTCLLRDNNKYYFFDSYGINEKNELSFIDKTKRIKYNENINYLDRLLKGYNYTNNKNKFQKFNKNINTCGRWVYIIIYIFKCFHKINFDDIYKLMMNTQKKYKLKDLDNVSVFLTN
jgi:hypothetical protein